MDTNEVEEVTVVTAVIEVDAAAVPATEEAPKRTYGVVTVKSSCRWEIVTAAGILFSRTPSRVSLDAPYVAELRDHTLLDFTEEEE